MRKPDRNRKINIGLTGENLVTEVAIPLEGLGSSEGQYTLYLQRPKDTTPYPVVSRLEGEYLIWTVLEADTEQAGTGRLTLRWDGPSGEVGKRPDYIVNILASTDDPVDPADGPYSGFARQIAGYAKDARKAADEATAALEGAQEGKEAVESARDAAQGAAQTAQNLYNQIKQDLDEGKLKGEKGDKGDVGPMGPTGPQGDPGYTPQKGVDYWTAEEVDAVTADAVGKAEEAANAVVSGLQEQLTETKAALTTTQDDLKKAQRAIQFQAALNKGQTWDFETDDSVAYSRTVPSGAKAGAVMAVGGKTVVWNQLCNALPNPGTYKGVKVAVSNGKVSLSGTATDAMLVGVGYAAVTVSGHKYMATGIQGGSKSTFYVQGVNENNGYYDILDSTAIFAATGTKYRYNIIAVAGTVFDHTFQPMVIDLTLMFGPGNEPADTSDPRIAQIEAYAAAHPEYNAGELVSALVDEVRVAGKNVAQPVSAFSKSGVTMSADKDGVYHFSGTATAVVGATSKKFTLPGGTYTVSVKSALPANVYVSISSIPALMVGPNTVKTGKFEGGTAYVYLYIGKGVIMDNVSIAFQVERGTTRTAYVPYQQPITYPIPSAVQALPGYGWSAGNVANTVERTENGWQYVQRVVRVDLGTLDWYDGGTGTSARRMVTRQPPDNVKIPQESSKLSNLVCSKYEPVTPDDTWTCVKEGISLNKGQGTVLVYDSAFATAESLAAFKAHITGVPLYYELATPITTDITALMGDTLAPFAVEAGGSITLHHPKADEGFAIDVPAKIQYITKLSEVSANG